MKKSNGVYFPEEVSDDDCFYLFFESEILFLGGLSYISDCETCSETLQVVHSTTVSGGIFAWQFCSTSGPQSKKMSIWNRNLNFVAFGAVLD